MIMIPKIPVSICNVQNIHRCTGQRFPLPSHLSDSPLMIPIDTEALILDALGGWSWSKNSWFNEAVCPSVCVSHVVDAGWMFNCSAQLHISIWIRMSLDLDTSPSKKENVNVTPTGKTGSEFSTGFWRQIPKEILHQHFRTITPEIWRTCLPDSEYCSER